MKKAKTKAQKSESRAKATVTVLTCLVAVCLCGVIGVSTFTDFFSGEREVKAVALVLSQSEQDALQSQLSMAAPLIDKGFKCENSSAKELLSYVLPGDDKGLYACYGYEKAEKQDTPDPAKRFQNEVGEYSFYKIEADKIDKILDCFDISIDHTVNLKDIYCYDGYYYFGADSLSEVAETSLKASVDVAKRIQDGRYYVTCSFGSKTAYVVATKSDDEQSTWKICEISSTPLFDQLGIMIKPQTQNVYNYEMKTQIIEGKTDDGVLYCKYTLTYPEFYGESAGEKEANRFYQSVLSYYEQLSGDSTKLYKSYVKSGGETDKLPLEVNYSAKVTYNNSEYIGVTNEIGESLINISSGETDEEDEGIIPSNKSVEAYVFDAETGDYVSKDSILGKDYQLIEELLYRLYIGYDYADLFSESVNPAEVPEDTEDLGEKIYLSASTFCDEGYMFCFVTDEGYRQDVVIPFGTEIFEIKADEA